MRKKDRMRFIVLLGICILFAAGVHGAAQSERPKRVAFEVASVKPNRSATVTPSGSGPSPQGCHGSDVKPDPSNPIPLGPLGRCVYRAITVQNLITLAYKVSVPRFLLEDLVSGPSWIHADRFEIDAKAEDPKSTTDELHLMLQSLLEERFKLKLHHTTREVAGFALVVAKDGPKFHPSPANEYPGGRVGKAGPHSPIAFQSAPVARLVDLLTARLGKPIVDKTNLSDSYDFTLTWTADATELNRSFGPGDDPAGTPLLTAIQDQLGLRLVPLQVPLDFIIVDHVERPITN